MHARAGEKHRMNTNTNIKEYSYGEVIRQHRLDLGMTQRQVADQCGITDSALAHIEREMRLPSEPVAGRIAKALDLSENDRTKFNAELKKARKRQAHQRVRNRAIVKPIFGSDLPDLDTMARELAADPDLLKGCHYLKVALRKHGQRKTLMRVLEAWASDD